MATLYRVIHTWYINPSCTVPARCTRAALGGVHAQVALISLVCPFRGIISSFLLPPAGGRCHSSRSGDDFESSSLECCAHTNNTPHPYTQKTCCVCVYLNLRGNFPASRLLKSPSASEGLVLGILPDCRMMMAS